MLIGLAPINNVSILYRYFNPSINPHFIKLYNSKMHFFFHSKIIKTIFKQKMILEYDI